MIEYKNKNKNNLPITLVCATHKRPIHLFKLLNTIEKNLFKPEEIIIVGTNLNDFSMLNNKRFSLNIKKIISTKKNQTFQRNLGISMAKSPILAQCDDDLLLDRNFFSNMYKNFQVNINKKYIIGAKILTSKNNIQSERWNASFSNYFLFRLILKILNKFKKIENMSLLSSGRIAPRLSDKYRNNNSIYKIKNLEWVSSTLCYNLNKIHKIKFFELNQEKSYFEDVCFTYYHYKKGFKLMIDSKILCFHPVIPETDFLTYNKTIKAQWEIVKFFKKSKILFCIDVIIFGLIFFVKDFLKRSFKK